MGVIIIRMTPVQPPAQSQKSLRLNRRVCVCVCVCTALTAVYSYPQLQLLLLPVTDLKGSDGVQQSERHAGNLSAMQLPVPHRQPRHHHVGIADGLHLGAPQDHDNRLPDRYRAAALIQNMATMTGSSHLEDVQENKHRDDTKGFYLIPQLY